MRALIYRHYPGVRLCPEFFAVVEFLKRFGAAGLNENWHWARWEWLICHVNLDEAFLPQIGVFYRGEEIVGVVTHDMDSGRAYIICRPDFDGQRGEMLDYSGRYITDGVSSSVFVADTDSAMRELALKAGYKQTVEKEYVLSANLSKIDLSYSLPKDFSITDFAENGDINSYCRVIWLGFENDGEPPFMTMDDVIARPHQFPELTVFALSADGEYAAHCGVWFVPGTEVAYLEPLVTIPKYRLLGLGRAVVYEALRRCRDMGAKRVSVISNQKFYHKIGFSPAGEYTLWTRRQ